MKTKIRFLSLVLSLILLMTCIPGCARNDLPEVTETSEVTSTEAVETSTVAETTTEAPAPAITVTAASLGNDVSLHTDLQTAYLLTRYQYVSRFAGGTAELSIPESVTLTWSVSCSEEASPSDIKGYTVELSENSDMTDPVTFSASEEKCSIYNLKVGTRYYWTVSALTDTETYKSEVAQFKTETLLPRNMYVDGITNVRDLGGWKTANGGTVRQGLLIRCGRLNSNSSSKKEISDKGIETMLEQLGVKTEIDLRLNGKNGNITESPLGPTVNYKLCPMAANSNTSGVILTDNVASTVLVFKILADEKNYPVIFHCSIGTDRTGMIAFLVNGLLGVSTDDLYTDYLYSNFGKIGSARTPDAITNYLKKLDGYAGTTLSEKINSYLLSIGVTQSEIDSVIRILRDDTHAKN